MPTKNTLTPSTASTGSQQLFQQLGLPALTFGTLLEAYRTEHNLTQEAIAQQLGTVKQRICDYEAGRRLPTLKSAHQIALTLGGGGGSLGASSRERTAEKSRHSATMGLIRNGVYPNL